MGPRRRAKLRQEASTAPEPASSGTQESEANAGSSSAPQAAAASDPTKQQKKPEKLGKPPSSEPLSTKEPARSTPKWYGGGTWPRISKASAITQVARENIAAAASGSRNGSDEASPTGAPSTDSHAKQREAERPPRSASSLTLSRGRKLSDRALPVAATTTKINISSRGPNESEEGAPGQPATAVAAELQQGPDGKPNAKNRKSKSEDATKEQGASKADAPDDEPKESAPPSAGWLGWFPGASSGAKSNSEPQDIKKDTPVPKVEEQNVSINNGEPTKQSQNVEEAATQLQPKDVVEAPSTDKPSGTEQYGRSWFGYWYSRDAPKETTNQEQPTSPAEEPPNQKPDEEDRPPCENNAASDPAIARSSSGLNPARASAWSFWAKATTAPEPSKRADVNASDSPSKASQPTESQSQQASKKPEPALPKKELVVDAPKDSASGTGDDGVPLAKASAIPQSAASAVNLDDASIKQPPRKQESPNLLLPSLRDTYRPIDNPSLLRQLARLFLPGQQPPLPKHASLVQHPPRISRALAIGVHGFFPTQIVRTIIGRPTGTSVKFASAAADAIKEWTAKHGYECAVEAIALEGEGKIAERVDLLWKLMLQWIEKIQKADFLLFACHSQGAPVAMMLVARLVEFGCISSTARVAVCAMAGINLGPFPDFKSRFFSGSAGELFEFTDCKSQVSQRYHDALRIAVKHGVKILFVGSIDDQLVPLESAIFSTISHPYIYRAVFIDGRVHAPDFLTHLVGFAMKVRNLGISDHGLIRELSSPLAGSLYSGEGHSRLYDDPQVYSLAVEYALETTAAGDVPLQEQPFEPRNQSNSNPFILPWSMRGLLEEEYVRTVLQHETAKLLALFNDWRPSSKLLKDVKFRLEAIKSKR